MYESGSTAVRVDGALLCGGLSRRMGRDKALLPVAGKSLLQHQIDLMSARVECLWLVGDGQYSVKMPENGAFITDYLPGHQGPLSGVLAALLASEADYLWLMSCDNYGFDAGLLDRMVNCLQQTGADLVYWEVECDSAAAITRAQPLIALLRGDLSACLQAYLKRGERAVMGWYQTLDARVLRATDASGFVNLNTEEDYQQLLKRVGC